MKQFIDKHIDKVLKITGIFVISNVLVILFLMGCHGIYVAHEWSIPVIASTFITYYTYKKLKK